MIVVKQTCNVAWYMCGQHHQGVVTPKPAVDTLATGIKNFDRENNALIT